MDGVLVEQQGRKHFDLFPWLEGGRLLVKHARRLFGSFTLLSAAPDKLLRQARVEKRLWADLELGQQQKLIVVADSEGKAGQCQPGDILVDDGRKHRGPWQKAGGLFILHYSWQDTVAKLELLAKPIPPPLE